MLPNASNDSSNLVQELAACSHVETSSVDSNIHTLNQSILALKEDIVKLTQAVAFDSKIQRLNWAISYVDLNAFTLYKHDRSDSISHVKSVLISFKQGLGQYIKYEFLYDYGPPTDEDKKRFRDSLAAKIHELIGQKPRIELVGDRYMIFYS